MSKIHHHVSKISHAFKNITLTTPVAILLGAVIISGGLMGYGLIMQGGTSGTPGTIANPLPKMLKALGINKNDFATCLDTGAMASAVGASTQDGIQAGVTGTPTTFIIKEENGVQYVVATVSGAQTHEFFKQAIDQALTSTTISKLPRFTGKNIDPSELEGGVKSSKVYVVEYSDLECPFCISVYGTLKQIRTEYKDSVSFAYRNFPLTQIHQHAQKEAEMISCVAKLGGTKAYYSIIDSMFEFKIKNNIGYIPVDSK